MQMFYYSIYKQKAFLRYEQFDEISHYYGVFQLQDLIIKFTFSEKATKIEKKFHHQFDSNVKSTVKISSIFVVFFENTNFTV